MLAAAEAFRSAGDSENELRVLTTFSPNDNGDTRARYFALLLTKNTRAICAECFCMDPLRSEATDYAVAHGSADCRAVVAAGDVTKTRLEKILCLAGWHVFCSIQLRRSTLHFSMRFGDQNIGERLGSPSTATTSLPVTSGFTTARATVNIFQTRNRVSLKIISRPSSSKAPHPHPVTGAWQIFISPRATRAQRSRNICMLWNCPRNRGRP